MKFNVVEGNLGYIKISLNPSRGRSQQLFYGPVYRGLDDMEGHYDHKNENLWPEHRSWEESYIDSFIEHCQNGRFMGIYLLWFISHLPIVAPKIKIHTNHITNGKQNVDFEYNITLDAYDIRIIPSSTECEDADKIAVEVSKALESFNIDNVFNEMVEHYKKLHFKTFGTQPSKKLFGILPNPFFKKEKEEKSHYPCWRNRVYPYKKTWTCEEALDVLNNEFEENKISFYEQLA